MKITPSKVLRYLCVYPLDTMRSLPFLIFAACARTFNPSMSADTYARAFSWLFLFRNPSVELLEKLSLYLRNVGGNPLKLLLAFFMLPEGFEKRIFASTGNAAHHAARLHLVRSLLPSAKHVLDLGGSTTSSRNGALLLMGYPHQPETVTIVDLPPEHQFQESTHLRNIGMGESFLIPTGTEVRYLFTSMSDLTAIATASVDLVWSGQSIEHISREQAVQVLKEVRRVLRPSGRFCLDTPNRRLSKPVCRMGFLHPEHKIEYYVADFVDLLQTSGFRVETKLALSPLPLSRALKKFCRLELLHAPLIGNDAEDGFSFYVSCVPE